MWWLKCIVLHFLLAIVLIPPEVAARKKPTTKKCTLPAFPNHGTWSVASGSNSPFLVPGYDAVAGTALNIHCNPGYKLSGPAYIICIDTVWSSPIGECEAQCPTIRSTRSTNVTCIYPNGEEKQNCTNVENGTWAKFTCNKFYEFKSPTKSNNSLLCENGTWKYDFNECVPKCGIQPEASTPNTSSYPWVVGVYDSRSKEYLCGGTLISERVVLALAHCMVYHSNSHDSWPAPTKNYLVAVGKFYNKFNDDRDSTAQYSRVKEIFFPIHGYSYQGFGDISVMITKKPFILSQNVLPVCIDWDLKYENQFTDRLVNGIVSGWRFNWNVSEPMESLQEYELPYVPYDECLNKSKHRNDLTNDKLCAGYEYTNTTNLCLRDIGAGLVFKNINDSRYYLVGITALTSDVNYEPCTEQQYSFHTKISNYVTNLILEKELQFRPKAVVSRFKVEEANVTEPLTIIHQSQLLCGFKTVKTETLIVGGNNATRGDYPWQIALYDLANSKKTLICGGSLITRRIILTAAHCVTDPHSSKVNRKERYLAVSGKYYRDFDDPRDQNAQSARLKEIFVPPQYEGDAQNYMGDIAILVTEIDFKFSKFVQPICIDWNGEYESQPFREGIVAGWGNTIESGGAAEALKDLHVPYVDRQKCKTDLPADYGIYLTFDKICSGYLNKSASVCNGDSGSGLVFKIPGEDQYYIAGIVSVAPKAPTAVGGCDSQQYSLYTRVSHYITNFILAKVRLFL